MNCPNCQTVNLSNATFCSHCGGSLAAARAAGGSAAPAPGFDPHGVDPASQEAAQKKSRTYLIEAIVVTLCCCQIAGIVAIVYAAMASGQAKGGDIMASERYAKIARRWSIGGFAVGALVYGIYFLAVVLGLAVEA